MTSLSVDDLAVVTGPLVLPGISAGDSCIALVPGEVVSIIEFYTESDGSGQAALVYGYESDLKQWIDVESLTPMSQIQEDENVGWGDLLDPDYIHDYVFEGNE